MNLFMEYRGHCNKFRVNSNNIKGGFVIEINYEVISSISQPKYWINFKCVYAQQQFQQLRNVLNNLLFC